MQELSWQNTACDTFDNADEPITPTLFHWRKMYTICLDDREVNCTVKIIRLSYR